MTKPAPSSPPVPAPVRRLSRGRKLAYGLLFSVLVLAILEVVSRLFMLVQADNPRWQYHRNLVQTIGFPGMNEILEPDARYFWRVKPNLAGVKLTGKIARSDLLTFTVSTDASGHRVTPRPSAPRATVLFLGDSCTFGIGVEDRDAFPAQLGAALPDVACVNAGVPGYTSYQGRLLLEDLEARARADAVVLCFRFNDNSSWDGKSDAEQEALLEQEQRRWVNRSGLLNLLARVLPQRTGEVPQRAKVERPRLTDQEYAEQTSLMIACCRAHGSEPVLLVWPAPQQMESSGVELGKQAVLRRLASEQRVRLVDLVPEFRSHGGLTLFADIVHANAAGNRVVAAALGAALQEILRQPAPK